MDTRSLECINSLTLCTRHHIRSITTQRWRIILTTNYKSLCQKSASFLKGNLPIRARKARNSHQKTQMAKKATNKGPKNEITPPKKNQLKRWLKVPQVWFNRTRRRKSPIERIQSSNMKCGQMYPAPTCPCPPK